jgi:lipopolysaccharide export system protein LptA
VEELASAVQAGHVAMLRKSIKKQGGAMVAVEERSTAERAVYDGDSDRVTLTGGVMVMDAESTLWAAKVVVDRGPGDATAEGAVRVTYAQEPSGGKEGEPVHVLASRAELRGDGSGVKVAGAHPMHRAFFYGSAGRMARMWQGSSQVEAPEIELEQGARRMIASSTGEGMQVHTVMLAAGDAGGQGSGEARGRKESSSSVVRILSREMVYADGLREVVFSGGVVVEDADGRMKAQRATAYLQPAKAGGNAAGKGEMELFSGGNVDHIVATGRVEIDQPGRHGAGEQLVYTASDGMFVLTGTAAAPPQVEDESKGTVTGGTMRFHRGDDRVVVTSEGIQSGGTGRESRRRTETRVKQ